ncbi:Lrp/AsnC family transcriptional regulator [Croceicoccus sp. F390]|uniref:Lrp/AsnC family transcriptional regulator n=1 Tax=Croceicoccus esteveae TaxID=3075597 RepID=A0ABU2ZF09_9SPHN|nr:Lrp/AsnC family transcriptional regulator [Croceicoccus sp. F390]MDT0575180.1 Lrp/AsnC family transcriptional regulator [Croceicoccus sp. F390]
MLTIADLDELDRRLIEILGDDARLSNRKIAARLGVTEGTVRGRIRRLQQDRMIAFTAITDFKAEQKTQLAFVGIQTEVDKVRDIARTVADLSDISGVLITTGRFNILAICLFDTLQMLQRIASDAILALPGVTHVETSIAVKTVKYNSRVVRITEADHASS